MQFIEFMTFNIESEFLSLFVHGFKRAESRRFGRSEPGVATTILGGHILQNSTKPLGQTGGHGACGRHAKREGMSAGEAWL